MFLCTFGARLGRTVLIAARSLALAYFRGYTHLQIAKELNQPLGTIKTRVRLAMQKLRRLLQEDQFLDKSESASIAYPIDKKR
jgi:RNA polymerase sigma-70 factor (ECF subfamily)